MASIDVAKLLNKITQDIPGINTVLKALAKWDVSALTDVPDGAMQATTDANNNLTIKKKVSGSYTQVTKLMHDVDKLDGYHASASATANAVAVRNSSGALPGNILGNAVTADTATALAAGSVVPVNQGGTGATTASQARANLGVADGADFATHIAKQASPSVEGHVKLDALAADGSNTAAPGGFGLGKWLSAVTDYNNCVVNGWYHGSNSTANKPPTTAYYHVFVQAINTSNVLQKAYRANGADYYTRVCSSGVWSEWVLKPIGITDSTSTTSSTIAASATAVKAAYDVATAANSAASAAQITADSAVTAADYAQTKSGTSSTASSTAAKVVTCSGFTLSTNARIFVTFSNANTVADAITLNVNGTGAKPIYSQTGIISATNTALFAANQPIEFRYDGTGWFFYDAAKAVSTGLTQYGTCATASTTAAKVVTCSGFVLFTGAEIYVTFANANTLQGALTLNVNGTGAKSIAAPDGLVSASKLALFPSGCLIKFHYDGTYWRFVNEIVKGTYTASQSGSVYADGKKVQWGKVDASANNLKTITFLYEFTNTGYTADRGYGYNYSGAPSGNQMALFNLTTTTCQTYSDTNASEARWRVEGY